MSGAVADGDRDELRDNMLDDAELRARLARTWGTASSIIGCLATVDHKIIGRRYIITAFVFLFLGGVAAAAMRIQLAQPESRLIGPDLYNQLFTVHGTSMMFLFAVPVMEAFAVFLVPLMVGTRNIAFPRLNAFSYWVYLFGGLFLWISFMLNIGPDIGWFGYVPLSGPEYGPGKRADVWAQMITFTEVSALAVAVEIVVTTLKLRAPGMTLDRIPLFVWTMLVTSFLIIFAMPAVMVASSMLIMDRLIGTQFFNPAEGGDALLWQHLFWFFGHPEVYIIFLPAAGMVSAILPAFARRPVFGYLPLVLSAISVGFLSFGLWVHHMFTAGVPQLGASFFTASSMLIAIPNGIQIFCWLATLWDGRPVFKTPLLFVLGFIFTFVIGGLTGIMLASVPIDTQVHDTYFVVAHFHYVLIGGAVFPLLGAVYYWFPKVTGRLMSERLGKWNFWLMVIGLNLTFGPMHIVGLQGQPRRMYVTTAARAGDGFFNISFWNLVSSIGAFILAIGVGVFIVNIFWTSRKAEKAPLDPWDARSLEWMTSNPPKEHNFDAIPTVHHLDEFFHRKYEDRGEGEHHDFHKVATAEEILAEQEANADAHIHMPSPSYWPIVISFGLPIIAYGVIFSRLMIPVGLAIVLLGVYGWVMEPATASDADFEPPPPPPGGGELEVASNG
jgi:cytochrome c oxidase subunit 1